MLFTLLPLLPLLALASPTPVRRADGKLISSGRDGKCLSLPAGSTPADGTPVVSVDCPQASLWNINNGQTAVGLFGTNFALDLGPTPSNNGALKIWTAYPGLAAQNFFYTDDKRIAQTGGNQCLDEGANGPQTYQCTTGNGNQVWNVVDSSTPPTSSLSSSASSSPTSPPPGRGRYITSGRDGKCLSIPYRSIPGNGLAVVSVDCNLASTWSINNGETSVGVFGTKFALDLGSTPGNNGALKIWTAYPGLAAQNFYYTDDKRIAQTGGNQCLDEGSTGPQTYQCTPGNGNQVWNVYDNVPPPTSTSSSSSASASTTPLPKPTGRLISSGRDGRCLSLPPGSTPANGVPVISLPCSLASTWLISNGQTAIGLFGTPFALDLGVSPGNNGNLKIWTAYPGLAAQNFQYNQAIKRISQTGGNQCLDEGDNGPQTYQCYDGNANQVWNVLDGVTLPAQPTASV